MDESALAEEMAYWEQHPAELALRKLANRAGLLSRMARLSEESLGDGKGAVPVIVLRKQVDLIVQAMAEYAATR